jgi:hypothetical protein
MMTDSIRDFFETPLRRWSVGLIVLLVALGAGGYLVLNNKPTSKNIIKGFEGLAWFSSSNQIIQQYGEPIYPSQNADYSPLQKQFNGQELLYPNRTRYGEDVSVGFVVHPDYGLVKGYYFVRFGSGRDCLRTSLSVLRDVRSRYDLRKLDGGLRNQSGYRFCYAVLTGQAKGYIQLVDQRGTLVTFTLGGELSRQRLLVQVEHPVFYDLMNNEEPFGLTYWLPFRIPGWVQNE